MVRKRIGIKYCGGCNPTYERVEFVLRVRQRCEGRFLFCRHDEERLAGLLLLSGCPKVCACEGRIREDIPHRSIAREDDLDGAIHWLDALAEEGGLT